jgi:hypothetical protein
MVWDIENDSKNNLVASTYSPFNTKIIHIKQNMKNTAIKCKTLVHNIEIDNHDSTYVLAGSRKHDYKNSASFVKTTNEKIIIQKELQNSGTFWDLIRIGDHYFAVGYGGMIYRIDQNGNIDSFKTYIKESLYELVEIDKSSFFIVGSNQTILKVNILNQTTSIK